MSAKNLSNTQSFLSRKWVLPAFGILAASIFVVVHLSNGEWDETPNLAGADGDNRDVFTGRDEGGGVLDEDEGSTFSYIPTKAPSEDLTLVPMPTSTTVVHPVPEIPDLEPSSGGDDGGGDGSNSTDDGGDGIITVPTTTTNGAPSVPATLDPAAPPSATLAPAPSFPATLDPAAPPSATLAPVIAPSAPSLPATLDPAAPPSATLSPTRDPASPPIDRPLEVATNVPSLSPSINPASPNAGSPVVVIIPFPDGNQPSSVPSINPASPNAGSPVVVIIPFPEGNRPTSAPSINPASPNAGSPVVVVIPFPEGDTPTSAPASPSTDSPVPGNTPTTAEPTEAPAIVTTPVSGPPTTPITSVPVPAAPVVVPPPPVPRPPVVVPQPIPVAPVAQQPPSPLPPRQPVPVVVPSPVQPSPGIPSVPGVPGQPGIPGGAGGGGNGGNGGTPGTGGSGGVPGQPGIPGGAGGGGNGGNGGTPGTGGGGGGGGNGGGGNSGGGGGGGSSGGGGGSSGGGVGSSGGGGGGGGGTGGGGSGNNGGWYPVPGGGGQGGGDNGQPPPWWWYPGYPPWAFPGNTGPPAFVPTSVPAPTPAPVPFHNTKFLEGCNPLQCILNEETDFHSMSAEDESIYEIFYTNPIKCCKVIIEIGAGDGDRYSTSRYFEEALNWRSLLIEANPDMYQQLVSNRPNSTTENAAFCEADHVLFDQGQFHAVGGSIEVTSESHTPPMVGSSTAREIPCISMRDIFPKYGITHVDVMVIRVQGDALAFIRSMDWTVRVDIWVVLMHGPSRAERDELVRTVLSNNEYVQAEWDIKRWCSENGQCLNNEVFLRKGFNPLPSEVQRSLASRHGPKKK